MDSKKARWLLAAAVATVVLCVAGFEVEFYRQQHFYCTYTMSEHGYRDWPFGLQSRHYRRTSALETFLEREGVEIEHQWRGTGTGYNVYGLSRTNYCGKVGPEYRLKRDFARWVQAKSNDEVVAFYELLKSEDYDAIDLRVKEIEAELARL